MNPIKSLLLRDIQYSDSIGRIRSIVSRTSGLSSVVQDPELTHVLWEHMHVLYDIRSTMGPVRKTYLEVVNTENPTWSISSQLMMSHILPSRIITVGATSVSDISNSKSIPAKEPVWRRGNAGSVFEYLDGPSYDPKLLDKINTGATYGGEQVQPFIDILFLNGCKTHLDTVRDWYNYMPMVRTGGFIIWNDWQLSYTWQPDAHRGMKECLDKLNHKQWEIMGCIPAHPAITCHDASISGNNMFIVRKLI